MTSEKTQHPHERALPSRLMVDVSGGESVTLEFKKSTAEKDEAARFVRLLMGKVASWFLV